MAAAKSKPENGGGAVHRVVHAPTRRVKPFDGTGACLQASSAVAPGKRSVSDAYKNRKAPRSGPGPGPGNLGRWASLPLSQLRQRLASTLKKIVAYTEEVARLRARISKKVEELDHVRAEKKVPSLEQAIAESSERQVDPTSLRQFQMSATARAYKGVEGDRKAMLSHRQVVQARARELGRAKEVFLEGIREQAILARNERLAEHGEAQTAVVEARNALKNAEARLSSCEEDKASLVEALLSVGDAVSLGGGHRARAERQKAVDDSLLSSSRAFRYHPSWLDIEQSARKIKLIKVSDNLLLIGCKAFGTKVPSSDELERMILNLMSGDGDSKWLRALYLSLIKLLVVDDVESGVGMARAYWVSLLSTGCWPEVIRRFILLRELSSDTPDYQRPDRGVSVVAGMLAQDNIESLTLDQRILILHYLGDTVLVDTRVFRDAILMRERENGAQKREIQEIARQSSSAARDARIPEIEMQIMERLDRRMPIGIDRYHRRYWWGLSGVRSHILVEDTDEFVAFVTSEAALNELLQSLDVRGQREEQLHRNISLIKDSVIRAIELKEKNAGKRYESTDEEIQARPARQSSRHTRQAEFYDPTPTTSKSSHDIRTRERSRERLDRTSLADQLSTSDQDFPVSVSAAMVDTIMILAKIGREAARLGIPPGDQSSWEIFLKKVATFGSEEHRHLTVEQMSETLRSQMCYLEKVLDRESRSLQGVKDKRGAPDPGLDKMCILAPPAPRHCPRTTIYLWNTTKERTSWLADVTVSSRSSPARLNYAARVLDMRAMPLLAKLA